MNSSILFFLVYRYFLAFNVYNDHPKAVSFSWTLQKYENVLMFDSSPTKYEIPSNDKKFIELWFTSKKLLGPKERKGVVSVKAVVISTQLPTQMNGYDTLNLDVHSCLSNPRRLYRLEQPSNLHEVVNSPNSISTTSQSQFVNIVISQKGINTM